MQIVLAIELNNTCKRKEIRSPEQCELYQTNTSKQTPLVKLFDLSGNKNVGDFQYIFISAFYILRNNFVDLYAGETIYS